MAIAIAALTAEMHGRSYDRSTANSASSLASPYSSAKALPSGAGLQAVPTCL